MPRIVMVRQICQRSVCHWHAFKLCQLQCHGLQLQAMPAVNSNMSALAPQARAAGTARSSESRAHA